MERAMSATRTARMSVVLLRLGVFVGLLGIGTTARAESITVLTVTNSLLTFDSATPGTILTSVGVTGLQAAETLLGIDFRPATGALFGLGSSSRLYSINPVTGAATQIGSAGAFTLAGNEFGFDFNPTVDRIRVVSDLDQNIRLNPNDGSLTATDTALTPGSSSVVGSAYSNNFDGATMTTLYAIDAATNSLMTQNPNPGILTLVGPLGVSITFLTGF